MTRLLLPAFLLGLACACSLWSTPEQTPITNQSGKLINGPPALELGTGTSLFVPLVTNQMLPLLDVDGGWALLVALRARNVQPDGVTMGFQIQDAVAMAPVQDAGMTPLFFNLVNGNCEALNVPLAVHAPVDVAGRPVWLEVTVQDKDGRQAVARGRVLVTGGPDAGETDGGTPDGALDAGEVDASGNFPSNGLDGGPHDGSG